MRGTGVAYPVGTPRRAEPRRLLDLQPQNAGELRRESNNATFVTGNLNNCLAVSVWKAAAAYEVGGRREPEPSEEAEEVAEERECHRDEQCECCKQWQT